MSNIYSANAKILVSPNYENQTIILSGPKFYTLKETVDLISTFLGRQIGFRLVPKKEWINELGGGDGPKIVASSFSDIERGTYTANTLPLRFRFTKSRFLSFVGE